MLRAVNKLLFGHAVSNLNIGPHQSPLFDDPSLHGLPFEDVTFRTSDGVQLHGWLVRGGTSRVVIQLHFGVVCNRAGYDPGGKGLIKLFPRKVEFLRHAAALRDRGYSVLLFDMRGHGTSDVGPTPWVTWGREEARDVLAAVDFVVGRPEFRDASVALLCMCMGTAAMTFAYGLDDGLRTRPNVKAVVAVQPILYKIALDSFGMPGFVQDAADEVNFERTGIRYAALTYMSDVKHIDVPTMVLQNKNDPYTKLDFVQAYFDELTCEQKELVWIEDEPLRAAAYDYLGREPDTICDWLDRFCKD